MAMTPEQKKVYSKVYDDLQDYLRFCKTFGHPYDEKALYKQDDENQQTYRNLKEGKRISNNWMRDAKLCGANIFGRRRYQCLNIK